MSKLTEDQIVENNRKVFTYFGEEAQLMKLIEECGEAISAISQTLNKGKYVQGQLPDEVLSEIADVALITDQFIQEYNERCVPIIEHKLERTMSRYFESVNNDILKCQEEVECSPFCKLDKEALLRSFEANRRAEDIRNEAIKEAAKVREKELFKAPTHPPFNQLAELIKKYLDEINEMESKSQPQPKDDDLRVIGIVRID